MDKRYIPNGEVQGDDSPIPETMEAQKGDYGESLAGEVSKRDLHPERGFNQGENLSKHTQSDKV